MPNTARPVKRSLGHLAGAAAAFGSASLAAPQIADACHDSDIEVVESRPVGDEWELQLRLCIGGGKTGAISGADGATSDFGIGFVGGGAITSFTPSTVVGQYTGTVLSVAAIPDPGTPVYPMLPACGDPNQPGYQCAGEATSMLYFYDETMVAPPFACITDQAACGPAHQQCIDVTVRFADRPDAFRVFGVEGAGNPLAGCMPNQDMAGVLGYDLDADGVFDSADVCPGGDDFVDVDENGTPDCSYFVDTDGDGAADTDDPALCDAAMDAMDADADGAPDSCDICPNDPHNDSDADGTCDAEDACPFDAFAEPLADGRCAPLVCGIQSAEAMPAANGWQTTIEVCSGPGWGYVNQNETRSLLLTTYGHAGGIAAFSPAALQLDASGPSVGSVVDVSTVIDPFFAYDGAMCARYAPTAQPCDDFGPSPAAALYYERMPALSFPWAQFGGCETVTITTPELPSRIRAFGLDGNGDVFGGCSADLAATINPVVVPDNDADDDGVPDTSDVCPGFPDDADADADGVADGCDACPSDIFNDSDGDGTCDGADACPLDPSDDVDGDGLCADAEPGCDLDPGNDADGDGSCAPADACPLDPQNDADGDGLCADIDLWDACDDTADADADGTPDACDVCPADFYNDSDADGACDSADPCPSDAQDDTDGDGSCDSADVCPGDADDDLDQDGICGNVDPCPIDSANDVDGDGICEASDNCPGVSNAPQSDSDGDMVGDACEPDADADGVIDDLDNCLLVANPAQADGDGDGDGDACDTIDSDGDGVADAGDACAGTLAGAVVNAATGCSVAQSCPTTSSWKNHGAYVSCVDAAADALVAQGVLTQAAADGVVAAAAQSNVGKKK